MRIISVSSIRPARQSAPFGRTVIFVARVRLIAVVSQSRPPRFQPRLIGSRLLSRRSRQRERLSGSVLSICSFVCLSLAKTQKNAIFSNTKRFRAMVSIDDLGSCNWAFQRTDYWISKNPRWLRSAIFKIDMTSFFSAEGGQIWIKFRRLVQNDIAGCKNSIRHIENRLSSYLIFFVFMQFRL